MVLPVAGVVYVSPLSYAQLLMYVVLCSLGGDVKIHILV